MAPEQDAASAAAGKTPGMTNGTQNMDDIWPVGKKKAYFTLAIVFFFGILDFMDRQVLAALFPYLKAEYSLTDTQLGMLVSILNISIAILVVPSGYLIDRWSRKKMLSLMGIIWSLATASCAIAGSYSQLMVSRFFVGFGEAGYNPVAQSLLTVSFPKRLRSTVIALQQTSAALGVPLGLIFGAFIAQHWGWRHAFGIVAIPGVLIAILALRIQDFKNEPKKTASAPAPSVAGEAQHQSQPLAQPVQHMSYLQEVFGILRMPSMLCIYASCTFSLLFSTAVMSWLPSYFNREAGMPITTASTVAAATMIFGTVVMIASGPFLDWLRRKGPRRAIVWQIFAGFASFVLSILCYYVATPGSAFQIICLLGQSVTGCALMPLAFTLVADLTRPSNRATAVSLVITLQNVFGMAVGPLLMGFLSDRFSLTGALVIMSFCYIVVGLAFVVIYFTYPKDVAKVGNVDAHF